MDTLLQSQNPAGEPGSSQTWLCIERGWEDFNNSAPRPHLILIKMRIFGWGPDISVFFKAPRGFHGGWLAAGGGRPLRTGGYPGALLRVERNSEALTDLLALNSAQWEPRHDPRENWPCGFSAFSHLSKPRP